MDKIHDFSVHHMTWKNRKQNEVIIGEFRKYFPTIKYRLVSDAGDDYSDFIDKFNIEFKYYDVNIFKGGTLNTPEERKLWLQRIYETCQLFETEWIVLFEDDVLTKNNNFNIPTTDCAGAISWHWNVELSIELQKINNNTENGYGMCGGSVFNRKIFMDIYNRYDEFPFDELFNMDNRLKYSDAFITCLFQYFGYTYSVWECHGEKALPNYNKNNNYCFIHGYKEYYEV